MNFSDRFRIAVGGENAFDAQPDEKGDPVLQILGVDAACDARTITDVTTLSG